MTLNVATSSPGVHLFGIFSVEFPNASIIGNRAIHHVGGTTDRRFPFSGHVKSNSRSFISRSVDWLIRSTDLTGSTLADLPLVGDRITATHVDGESLTCVVTEFNGEPCYQYSDEARSQLCVHCQELV